MIEETIRQLQDPDPSVRRDAIIALASSRNPAALRPLAAVYRSDPDPELRELAYKAGQYIREHGSGQGAGGPVSDRDREIARGYLSSATDFHIAGDRARAVENLGKALSVDPDLQNETFVVNLIMNTTGMAVAQAVPVLTHPDRRAALIAQLGGKQKLKRQQQHGAGAHTATWENVFKDFGVYWLAATMSMIAILIFALAMIQDLFSGMMVGSTSDNMDVLIGASIIGLLISSFFFGLYQVIALAMQGAFIHVAATAVLGGDGTLVYLFRRYVPFQTFVTIIVAGVLMLLGFTGDIETMLFVIGMGSTVGALYVTYLLSKLIGEVYNFGAWSGCGAIFIGGIIQAVVTYIGNYAILSLMGALLGAAS